MMPRWARWSAAGLAAALVLWAGIWLLVARQIEARAEAWIAEEATRGTRITRERLRVDGAPFTWRLVAEGYGVARDGDTPFALAGARIEARWRPWAPREVALHLPGPHTLTLGAGAAARRARLEAARPEAWLALRGDGRIRQARADLGDVTLRMDATDGAARIARATATLDLGADAPRATGDTILALSLALDTLAPPAGTRPPFDRPIRAVELDAQLRGAWPSSGDRQAQLAAWRDSGGVIDLTRLRLDWPPLALTGDGTGGLDQRFRPEAAASLRLVGVPETIDLLVAGGWLKRGQAAFLAAAAAGLARPGPASGQREILVPITAQDGRLSIGGMPVLPLSPLR